MEKKFSKIVLLDRAGTTVDDTDETGGSRVGTILKNVAYKAGYFIDHEGIDATMGLSKDITLRVASLRSYISGEDFEELAMRIVENPEIAHQLLDDEKFQGKVISQDEAKRLIDESFDLEASNYYESESIKLIAGVRESIMSLSEENKIGLTTGFSANVANAIDQKLFRLREDLGIETDSDDSVAEDLRPEIDLFLNANFGSRSDQIEYARDYYGLELKNVVTVGDTVSDLRAGVKSRAGLVVGVATGSANTREELEEESFRLESISGSTRVKVLDNLAELPAVI